MKVTLTVPPFGDDLMVVNAARVSFGKRSEKLDHSDERLIQFLARGFTSHEWDIVLDALDHDWVGETALREIIKTPTHWAPFAHPHIQLHFEVPIAIARQIFKHKQGAVESEVSRRYIATEPKVFHPVLRKAAEDKKQGSGGPLLNTTANWVYADTVRHAIDSYNLLIQMGVCPEQARFVLPQGTYTEFQITGSLYHWASFFNSRSRADAQGEIQDVAQQVSEIVSPLFPVSWKALTG